MAADKRLKKMFLSSPFSQPLRVLITAGCALGSFTSSYGQPVRAKEAVVAAEPAGEAITIRTHDHMPSVKGLSAEVCFPVKTFDIRGLEVLSKSDIARIVQPMAYRCVGNTLAQAVIKSINEAHADKGYVTTQAYVPAQNIKGSQTFRINIVSGRINRLIYREYNGDEGFDAAVSRLKDAKTPYEWVQRVFGIVDTVDNPLDRLQLIQGRTFPSLKPWLAFPDREGDLLQMDSLQQGVDQINRASSNKAEIKLEPGAAPGTSDVVIENRRRDSFRLFAGYEINGADINGSGKTTPHRLRIDAYKDNLIGINDSWGLSYAGGRDSNEVKASFSMPFRRFNFSLDAGYSENLSAVGKTTELFSRSFTATSNVSYLISRTKEQQTSIMGSIAWRHSERHLNSIQLTPQTLSIGRLGLQHIRSFDVSQLTLSFGVSHGLTVLDATRDQRPMGAFAPRAQFIKLDGSIGYSYAFKNIGVLKFDLAGQWAGTPLYGDDQLTLGSPSALRGFSRTVAKVDRGVTARSEFTAALPFIDHLIDPKSPSGFWSDVLGAIQTYAFSDFGHGRDLANLNDVSRASVGAGVRYKSERVSVDFNIAQPVYRRGTPSVRGGNTPEFMLTLSMKAL
jgi:hemolysin activation/secretion protein